MKTAEIRKRFLDYFAERGHEIVPGSSLVPGNDPTLLFTNSGMVQFKEVFLGERPRPSARAVTAQRCVRAGGKHNDLENVGYTARHHTFFEMLGNFSFGDYFKEEAIDFAWGFLTGVLKLPEERLWVTVYKDDDEAADIWLKKIGVPKERFRRISGSDNFWSMGDSGPCGPCSEVFYDHGDGVPGGPPGDPDQDGDRFVEIWNLVFMQFNRSGGKMEKLPKPSVDTGMGLERIAAVMQGVQSNYDIDLFRTLTAAAAKALDAGAQDDKSLRVIADHIRSAAFLITDGVVPSNEGRGYVLRRIIRRAVRHGYRLGRREPFLHKLVRPLCEEMGDAYPELANAEGGVTRALLGENEKFAETLEQGIKLLDREIAEMADKTIHGEVAFKLYDTYGFPLDLTADVARERGLQVDQKGFEKAMEGQRARARAASRFEHGGGELRFDGVKATRFVGYEKLRVKAKVLALSRDGERVKKLRVGERGAIALNESPFYAEGGGQVGDHGKIHFEGLLFFVDDTQRLANGVVAHIGKVADPGEIAVGDRGTAIVAEDSRRASACNHSATHLLHAALKKILGKHVRQQGSLVEPDRLRFDFAHDAAPSAEQLAEVEGEVNNNIRANAEMSDEIMDLEQAKADGAEALFGEKYDSRVRVVRIGESFELCGGTHVARSGDIGMFKITSESGIAAGVRRIEALTGARAEAWIAEQLGQLEAAAAAVKAPPRELPSRLQTLLEERRTQQRRIDELQAQLAAGGAGGEPERVEEINGVKLVSIRRDRADVKTMRMLVDKWKQKLGSGIVLVAGASDGKATVIAGVTGDLAARYHAGRLVETLASLLDGRGGGRAELAQGGGGKVAALDDALAEAPRWVAAA
ncbi:MAG: alanine--tRNA ligase [Gammaproteobacteria bacterium]|nr:alanine--tRNA ligase [Gammaproteobacteria bacterium]